MKVITKEAEPTEEQIAEVTRRIRDDTRMDDRRAMVIAFWRAIAPLVRAAAPTKLIDFEGDLCEVGLQYKKGNSKAVKVLRDPEADHLGWWDATADIPVTIDEAKLAGARLDGRVRVTVELLDDQD